MFEIDIPLDYFTLGKQTWYKHEVIAFKTTQSCIHTHTLNKIQEKSGITISPPKLFQADNKVYVAL